MLLGVIAITLCIEMKSLLIGESAAPAREAAIRDTIESQPGVQRVIHMRTQHIGPDELLVGVKLAFNDSMSFHGLAETINAVETAVRARVPEARMIYVEPDVVREAPT